MHCRTGGAQPESKRATAAALNLCCFMQSGIAFWQAFQFNRSKTSTSKQGVYVPLHRIIKRLPKLLQVARQQQLLHPPAP
jgi:hypothetical protein